MKNALHDQTPEPAEPEQPRAAILVTGDALQELSAVQLEEITIAVEWLLRARLGGTAISAMSVREVIRVDTDSNPQTVSAKLAEHVREMRTDAGYNQSDLAAVAKTSQSAISDLESGRAEPRISTFSRIAEATGNRVGMYRTPREEPEEIDLNLAILRLLRQRQSES